MFPNQLAIKSYYFTT